MMSIKHLENKLFALLLSEVRISLTHINRSVARKFILTKELNSLYMIDVKQ